MLISPDECLQLLRCPQTGLPLRREGKRVVTVNPGQAGSHQPSGREAVMHSYGTAEGRPVLVDFERSVLDEARTLRSGATSAIRRRSYRGLADIARRLVRPPNPASARHVDRFVRLLKAERPRPVVLVVGGASIGDGTRRLYDDPDVRLVGFDIYVSPNVQFIADGHRIPLADASVDGLVCQAVLEHVLEPPVVAAEIARVVRPGGLVYAETPFMQQVHEGAFDFTRFTESGHRYLFRDFEPLESGAITGPGVALLWSVDFFVRSLTRSRRAGKVAKLAFFWLPYLDRLVPEPFAVDGASGVYLLGRRSEHRVQPKELIASYRGAQR